MSVTSSGRSPMSATMSRASGWFSVMPFAMCLRTVVLPAFAGDRIRPRWPLPTGLMRLMSRWVRFFWSISRSNISSGKTGISASKCGRRLAISGSTPLTVSTRRRPQYFSWSFGWPGLAGDAVAGAQTEAADLRRADVDVLRRGHDAVDAQESEAVVDDLEDALGDARLAVAVARLGRRQGNDVEQLQDEVRVLELARGPRCRARPPSRAAHRPASPGGRRGSGRPRRHRSGRVR